MSFWGKAWGSSWGRAWGAIAGLLRPTRRTESRPIDRRVTSAGYSHSVKNTPILRVLRSIGYASGRAQYLPVVRKITSIHIPRRVTVATIVEHAPVDVGEGALLDYEFAKELEVTDTSLDPATPPEIVVTVIEGVHDGANSIVFGVPVLRAENKTVRVTIQGVKGGVMYSVRCRARDLTGLWHVGIAKFKGIRY